MSTVNAPSIVAAHALPAVRRTVTRFTEAVDGFSDAQFGSRTRLPDWDRKHLIAHVTNLAVALTRQVEFALLGRQVAVYDGGANGRSRGIEAGATTSPAVQRADLHGAVNRLMEAWPTAKADWDRRVAFADGTITDVLFCWWREIAIHLVDLDVGEEFGGFERALHAHLWDFLAERLPPGSRYELIGGSGVSDSSSGSLRAEYHSTGVADTDGVFEGGDHEPARAIRIDGTVATITAWLAGRASPASPQASCTGLTVPLPELLPWPSRAAKPGI